jgi:hypothetical protein
MKKVWFCLAALAFVGSAIFGWYFFAYQSFHDVTTPYFARNWVKAELTDPESATFRNQKGYCGEVNSKNRMGGYGGFIKFIATAEGGVKFDTGESWRDFNEEWAFWCEMPDAERQIAITKKLCAENPDFPWCKH